MAITVVDIAKRATVSVGTVSRVLNDNPSVGPEHKQRVMAAMDDLNYKPNRWARGIRKGSQGKQVGQIALIFINMNEQQMHAPYMIQYINGVQQELTGAGRKCLFLTWHDKGDSDTIPHILLDGEIDGIICKNAPLSQVGKQWFKRYPRVSLNPDTLYNDSDCVMVDYQAGAYRSVEYLAARGHRRIAFVSPGGGYFQTKLIGYRQAVKRLGLDADDDLIQVRHVPSESYFGWAIDNLWSLDNPPTAIMSNDYSCSGIYKALIKRGLKIPHDVSVVGYDNSPNYCEALVPELTSMEIEAANIGKAAVQQLFLRIKNPDEAYRKILIQGKLVERESVKDRS